MHPSIRPRTSRRTLARLALAGAMLATSACNDLTAPPATPLLPPESETVDFLVTDETSGAPLAGALVMLDLPGGAKAGAISDANGLARLAALPVGTHTMHARRIGYAPIASTLRVGAGAPRQERLRLRQTAICTLGSTVIVTERRTR